MEFHRPSSMSRLEMLEHAKDMNGDIIVEDVTSDAISLLELEEDLAGSAMSTIPRCGSDVSLGSTSKSLPIRAQTRLLSRSHSVSDLMQHERLPADADIPRRNSSGEQIPELLLPTPQVQPSPPLTNEPKSPAGSHFSDGPYSSPVPTAGMQLSPISLQYPPAQSAWKPQRTAASQEDSFGVLLHTTAERVLTRLKSRQQDLGGNFPRERKYPQRNPSLGHHQTVPRKLQPLFRDGSKSPTRRDSDHQIFIADSEDTV